MLYIQQIRDLGLRTPVSIAVYIELRHSKPSLAIAKYASQAYAAVVVVQSFAIFLEPSSLSCLSRLLFKTLLEQARQIYPETACIPEQVFAHA